MCSPIYFTPKELTTTDTGLPNIPESWQIVSNLQLLGSWLDTIRMEYKRPIIINSGYRSKAVNEKVGGVETSLHRQGLAADIRGNRMKDLWWLLMNHIGEIDELIQYIDSKGSIKWIHVGITRGTPRGKVIYKTI